MKIIAAILAAVFLGVLAGCAGNQDTPEPIKFAAPKATSPKVNLASLSSIPTVTSEPDLDRFELIDVGIGADGQFVVVNFKSPPALTQNWWQGSIYIVDEASGTRYDQIPVAPVIGPLFGKPRQEGQAGYIMLTNAGSGIHAGSVVTVVAGKYKREHLVVKGS